MARGLWTSSFAAGGSGAAESLAIYENLAPDAGAFVLAADLVQFGSAGADRANAVRFDVATGGVYATGYSGGDLFGANAGGTDFFVARLSADTGATGWGVQAGGAGDDNDHVRRNNSQLRIYHKL